MITGLAYAFRTTFRVGAQCPILMFGHQIAYLIGRPLLLIVGGTKSKSYKQCGDKHYVDHEKGDLRANIYLGLGLRAGVQRLVEKCD
jgi:hypothetical protein